MSWDPFQRQVLAELGHVVYRQAGVASASDAEVMAVQHGTQGNNLALIGDPMLARIAHAAGMTVEAMPAGIFDVQLIAALRANPAAKRALWARLRALRRQRGV